ncbi:MAG: hypothetical protein VX223_15295 [Myxococcota bacterium]|nr:hypothetical protein [Myxococcota bacterium]
MNDDCEPLPCEIAACVDGLCQGQPDPGACDAACFQAASGVSISITTNGDATASWTDGPAAGAVLGSWDTPMGTPASADWTVGTVRVWGEQNTFRFRYDAQMPPGCENGALELRIDGILVWQACGSATAEWVSLPISADSGVETRTLEFRLRGGVSGSGFVVIDAVTVLGTCQQVQCTEAVDCDDGSECTDDSCIGYECMHLSNQSICSDGNACTTGDTCLGGECITKAIDCNDNNPCTDDACEPSSGCVFIPNVMECDDGEPCTAGDACIGGNCIGTPVVCKDLSDCTIDGCTPGVGCQFQLQPFGAECNDGGITQGACVEGICTAWEQSQFPTGSYISTISERSGPLPLRAAGSVAGVATVWTLDQATAAPTGSVSTPNFSEWRSTGGGYLSGDNAALASITAPTSLIDVGAMSSLPLHAVAVSGQLLFTAGDGYAHGQVTSTVRRCKLSDGSINGCQVMPVVKSPEQCGSQVPFHVRAITVVSPQSVLFAGTAISGLDAAAVVAEWNGNTNDACDALGIYSGEVYSTGGATLRVNALGLGRKESFQALGQSNDGTVWTAGTGGMIYRRQDGVWYGFNPADWPAGAGFHGGYEIRALHAGQDQVFFVGDGVGLVEPGCPRGFLLRAVRVGQHWWVDHMNRFSWLKSCGANASDAVELRDVVIDGLTDDLLIGGYATENGTGAGLVLRLRAPGI